MQDICQLVVHSDQLKPITQGQDLFGYIMEVACNLNGSVNAYAQSKCKQSQVA